MTDSAFRLMGLVPFRAVEPHPSTPSWADAWTLSWLRRRNWTVPSRRVTAPASLRGLYALAVASYLSIASLSASAAVISYSLTSLGGQDWRYNYTIANNTPASIDEFSIYFSAGLYTNLQLTGAPSSWDWLVVQPDLALPAAGFVDGLALVDGLGAGQSLSGLSVSFTFFGTGSPADQPFDVVDPITFAPLASGTTTLAVPPPPPGGTVPEPATLSLLVLACFLALRPLHRLSRRVNKTSGPGIHS